LGKNMTTEQINKELSSELNLAKESINQLLLERDEAREDAKWMSMYAKKAMDCLMDARKAMDLMDKQEAQGEER